MKGKCQCGNPSLKAICGAAVTHREDRCTFTTPKPPALIADEAAENERYRRAAQANRTNARRKARRKP